MPGFALRVAVAALLSTPLAARSETVGAAAFDRMTVVTVDRTLDPPIDPRAGRALSFERTFSGGTFDAAALGFETAFPDGRRSAAGNLQVYSDAGHLAASGIPDAFQPFSIENGRLVITARAVPGAGEASDLPRFVSGLLTTRPSFALGRGYAEARMKLPRGAGLWPAFWLFRLDESAAPYGEIDVVEALGEDPHTAYSTIHAGADWKTRHMWQAEIRRADDGGFHDYGVERTSSGIVFYLDGRITASFPAPAEADVPMYLLLNLAVGGPWSDPPDPAAFPARLEVEWIRAWSERN